MKFAAATLSLLVLVFLAGVTNAVEHAVFSSSGGACTARSDAVLPQESQSSRLLWPTNEVRRRYSLAPQSAQRLGSC